MSTKMDVSCLCLLAFTPLPSLCRRCFCLTLWLWFAQLLRSDNTDEYVILKVYLVDSDLRGTPFSICTLDFFVRLPIVFYYEGEVGIGLNHADRVTAPFSTPIPKNKKKNNKENTLELNNCRNFNGHADGKNEFVSKSIGDIDLRNPQDTWKQIGKIFNIRKRQPHGTETVSANSSMNTSNNKTRLQRTATRQI